jgi:2-iminobutanoate/2-iminopropanoate deaminase
MAKRTATHDVILSRKAPKPIGPYSQALRVKSPGEMLFVSGQIPIEANGKVFSGDIKRQAEIAIMNLRNIILDAKFTMDDIVKVTVYLTDLKQYDAVNEVYQKQFVGQSLPARAVVQVAGLPQQAGIEVEAIAIKKGASVDEMFGDDAL